jgi:hypothetical protein
MLGSNGMDVARYGDWRRAVLRLAVAGGVTLSLIGCKDFLSSLLTAKNPSSVTGGFFNNPANADLIVASAEGDLHCALGNYIIGGGQIADELNDAELERYNYDRRTAQPSGDDYATATCQSALAVTGVGVYTPLSTARWSADNAHRAIAAFTSAQVPDRGQLLAAASAYGGYARLLLGEAMCNAAIDGGPKLTRQQLWQLADSEFTLAVSEARAAHADSIVNLALVGRARAQINLATNPVGPVAAAAAAAAADAAQVPAGFVWNANYSATNQSYANPPYEWITFFQLVSIKPGFWNLTFGGVPDPRVSLNYTGLFAHDGITPRVEPLKYPSATTPIPLARSTEAQLIVAEVQGGQTAVNIINALHAAAGLPPFSSSDPAAIHNQVIEERRRELFLESHRLNDMIRFGVPFLPPAGTPYVKGGIYGTTTCLPIPFVESQNNPNITG